jgi:SSS family solute:Na+ symporter
MAMLIGLVLVPVVSLFTPKMDKATVEKMFAGYNKPLDVAKKPNHSKK